MLYGYQTWPEESLMQVEDDDDLHGGQLRRVLNPAVVHKSRVSQSLPFQVSLSLGKCYTLVTAIKGD